MAIFRYDLLWKGIMEDLFQDCVLFFSPELHARIDWTREVVFLNREVPALSSGQEDTKFIDFIARTALIRQDELYIHIEVQGRHMPAFAQRMYRYHYRLRDRFERLVYPLAIFTDWDRAPPSSTFEEGLGEYRLKFEFPVRKVTDYDEEELRQSSNPFAMVILTVLFRQKQEREKRKKENTALDLMVLSWKIYLADLLLQKNFSLDVTDKLMDFLRRYIKFSDPEFNAKFDEATDQLTNKKEHMGIKEALLYATELYGRECGEEIGEKRGRKLGKRIGREEGKELERREAILKLRRNLHLNDEEIAGALELPLGMVKKVLAG